MKEAKTKKKTGRNSLMIGIVCACLIYILLGGYYYVYSVKNHLTDVSVSNVLAVTRQQQAFDNFIAMDKERIHSHATGFSECDSNDIEAIKDKLALFSETETIYSVINLETGSFYNNKTEEAHFWMMLRMRCMRGWMHMFRNLSCCRNWKIRSQTY